jgi:hypothetical protein
MIYENFKRKFAIDNLIKYTEILNPKTIQEQIWNSTVRQGLVFRIIGHLGITTGPENIFKILAKVYKYDEDNCTLSQDFLENEHILYIGESRLPHVEKIDSLENKNSSNEFPHVCPNCGAPAYIGIFSVDCSKKCH